MRVRCRVRCVRGRREMRVRCRVRCVRVKREMRVRCVRRGGGAERAARAGRRRSSTRRAPPPPADPHLLPHLRLNLRPKMHLRPPRPRTAHAPGPLRCRAIVRRSVLRSAGTSHELSAGASREAPGGVTLISRNVAFFKNRSLRIWRAWRARRTATRSSRHAPPPPSRTNWTRLVPPSVLTGNAPRPAARRQRSGGVPWGRVGGPDRTFVRITWSSNQRATRWLARVG